MKIIAVQSKKADKPIKVLDSFVDDGYFKAAHGSLPDVDCDFDAVKRQQVKEYLERRYNHDGKQRVFSVGTFTTEKLRSVIKDVCRVHRIPIGITNYITAILDDKGDFTDLFKTAYSIPKVKAFIEKHWQVFEEIAPLMYQARSTGIHASALIITPDVINGRDVDCFDCLPIRKMDEQLVSEISGYDADDIGLLKNDILGIKELSRLDEMMNLCNQYYHTDLTLLKIVNTPLDDPKVYDALRKGLTQGVFQLSSKGMTHLLKSMKPDNINDLIAAAALFRPATLKSGAAQAYVDCKNGLIEPQFAWGTHDILKDTFGAAAYQEQLANLAKRIGGLSLGEGVNLVKAISKKKVEKIRKFKEKFFNGAKNNKCPKEAADKIWNIIELGAQYCFNKSHATAYGITAYVGAWIKVNYPVAFYTVILKWADENDIPAIMAEMREIPNTKISQPDINISGLNFETNFETNEIFWSLLRIKQVGAKAVDFIVRDRAAHGEYKSMEDFIKRIFRKKLKTYKYWDDPDNEEEFERCPVNARHVRNLIMSGAFDNIEKVGSLIERYGLLQRAALQLGFEVPEKEVPQELVNNHWFWSQQQINLSGYGAVDYKRIYNAVEHPTSVKRLQYFELKHLIDDMLGEQKVMICATISTIEEKSYKDKKTGEKKTYAKIIIQQNIDSAELILWNDAWNKFRNHFVGHKDGIIVFTGNIKWSNYDEKNIIQINSGAYIKNV